MIELFHGYTYWGHPLAAVAGLATLEAYREEGISGGCASSSPISRTRCMPAAICPVSDIRNLGLMGAIELEPLAGQPGKRGFELMIECYERGLMVRMAMGYVRIHRRPHRDPRGHRPDLRHRQRGDPGQGVAAAV